MNKLIKKPTVLFFLSLLSFGVSLFAGASNTMTVNLKGNLILYPPCELTSTGDVDFGDVLIRKMETAQVGANPTSAAYQQVLPYQLKCDAPNGTTVHIALKGSTSFNENFLGTNNKDVGIQFINKGKGTFTPNRFLAGVNVGEDSTFIVVPIRNPAATKIAAGVFTATAVLVADYA